jgi:hypothetical protein
MLRFVLVLLLAMSILIVSIILLLSHFAPVADLFLFGQPKLDCKPCICHPECHCETQCIQQQIMQECNLGVDTHNTLLSHHTHENRTTRLILVFSLLRFWSLSLSRFRSVFSQRGEVSALDSSLSHHSFAFFSFCYTCDHYHMLAFVFF